LLSEKWKKWGGQNVKKKGNDGTLKSSVREEAGKEKKKKSRG